MISNKLIGLAALAFLCGGAGFTAVGCSSETTVTDDDADDDSDAATSSSSSGGRKDGGASSSGGEPEACFGEGAGPIGYNFPPATVGQNKCTTASYAALKTACFDDASTQATCDAYKAASATNAACLTCVGGGEATDPFPVVVPVTIGGANYSILNVNGCIAAVAGVSDDCASVVSNISACVYGNCESCEAADPNNAPDLDACIETAQTSDAGCKELVDAASCLESEGADSGVTDAQIEAACGKTGDEFQARFDKIAITLCGPGGTTPPVDAGSDAN